MKGHPESRLHGLGRRLEARFQGSGKLLFTGNDLRGIEGPGENYLAIGAQGEKMRQPRPLALDLQDGLPPAGKSGNQEFIQTREAVQGQAVAKFPGTQAPNLG